MVTGSLDRRQADDTPLLLLIGSSGRHSREFVLSSVARRYRLWLMEPAEPTWQRPYVCGNTVVDNTDADSLVAAARELAGEREVSGVLCYDEGLIWPAARVAQALALPGNPPEAIAACRDKHATRAALTEAGVSQPASFGASSLAEAAAAAERIGYPVVLKPRGLAGSMGVRRADGPGALEQAYAAARQASYPGVPVFDMGVLVEEYVGGPEISVDAVFFNGVGTALAVARKQVAFEPFFEEVGHLVDGTDSLLTDPQLLDALARSHKALGFTTGVTHTEFRLTERGPRLLEVNARLGGGMIPYLGLLATGIDVAMTAADVAAGRAPETVPSCRRAAGVRFLYPERDVVVGSVTVDEAAVRPPIHSAVALADPGAVLRLPPRGYISRYGRVIALSDSIKETGAALTRAAEIIRLDAHDAART